MHWRSSLYALSFCFAFLLSGITCGCGSGNSNNGPTVTGIVMTGDKSAIANPVGAEGLVPVGAGTKVHLLYDDGITTYGVDSPTTNAQGRFSFRMKNDRNLEYYADIANTCSTVAGFGIHPPNGYPFATYDPGFDDGHTPSAAMRQKAVLAATALGVDVVIIIGTDADSCTL